MGSTAKITTRAAAVLVSLLSLTVLTHATLVTPPQPTTVQGSLDQRASTGNASNPVADAVAAIDAMNAFYNQTDGRWSTSDAWWVSGNALQAILDFTLKTGSDAYMSYALHTFSLQRAPIPWWPEGGGDFRADSTDDTGWWALAMIRFYDITGDEQYLDVAKEDEAYMYNYWNTTVCGGGVFWSVRDLAYKNAISNELYLALAVALHNRLPGDTHYLDRALEAWTWFNGSGLINPSDLINDGLAESEGGAVCANNNETTWSYNQGVILEGLLGLADATGDPAYLAEARSIADAAVRSPVLSPGGLLTESCDADDSCDGNQQAFKGLFCRYLAELDAVLPDRPYRAYLESNAVTMMSADRNSTNFYDVSWAGPFRNSSIAKQVSAVSLLVALI